MFQLNGFGSCSRIIILTIEDIRRWRINVTKAIEQAEEKGAESRTLQVRPEVPTLILSAPTIILLHVMLISVMSGAEKAWYNFKVFRIFISNP